MALSFSLLSTWSESTPRPWAKHYGPLSGVVQFLCVLTVLFSCVSAYRANLFLSLAFVAVGLHQLLAPEMSKREQRELEEKRKEKREKEAGGEYPSVVIMGRLIYVAMNNVAAHFWN